MPKVSVIIPIFGVEKYIQRCVESLFNQTLHDIEFIFINDCTPDGSMNILSQAIEDNCQRIKDMRWIVRIIEMPVNSGQAKVRNSGIQAATGDYIIHCDSDDWVEPNIYQVLWEYAVANNLDIVSCDYYIFSENSSKIHSFPYIGDKNKTIGALIEHSVPVCTWNKLIKKDVYNRIKLFPTKSFGEDYALIIQCYYYAHSHGHISMPLYHYFVNTDSVTRIVSERALIKRADEGVDNLNIVLSFIKLCNLHGIYEESITRAKVFYMNFLLPLVHYDKYREICLRFFSRTGIEIIKINNWRAFSYYCAVRLNLFWLWRVVFKKRIE